MWSGPAVVSSDCSARCHCRSPARRLVIPLWKIALAVWLIFWAVLQITNIRVEAANLLLGILAIVAAVLMLFDR